MPVTPTAGKPRLMPSFDVLVLFTLATIAMNLSPGPSNFYVMSRAIGQGFGAGVVAAAGLATGSLFHVAATATGLGVLLAVSPIGYAILKWAGAAYLVYLGIKALRAAPEPPGARGLSPKSSRRIFAESVLVEMLNPKAALFFLAFLPQFVDISAGPAAPQLLLLGLIVTVTAFPCDLAVAAGGATAAQWLARNVTLQKWQNRLSGSVMIGLGLWVATGERRG